MRLTLAGLKLWMDGTDVRNVDARARLVHGVAFAAFMALAEMLGSHKLEQMDGYKANLIAHCKAQVEEVKRSVNVDKFFTDLLAGLESDAFGITTPERMRLFKVLENKHPSIVLPEEQTMTIEEDSSKDWKSRFLYFQPEAVINMVKEYKRRIGENSYLDRSDLQAQMKTRPYWVENPAGIHRQRFYGYKTPKTCWCIDLDKHPLGYQKVSAEEWQASLHPTGDMNVGVLKEDWEDPRLGNLFGLVDAVTLTPKPKEAE